MQAVTLSIIIEPFSYEFHSFVPHSLRNSCVFDGCKNLTRFFNRVLVNFPFIPIHTSRQFFKGVLQSQYSALKK
jgi:hypothetical protein